ncbi:Ubiquitin thioesterase OTU1/2/3 like protein [Aduncisulcus paluster]|uniref:Ubiquitin thioesterase OTU n=1 Tax=Aduncisulcus paluster TaxID=2918883 RepID=A0ABQ5L1N5_9EUKA|nr:Ubiquitin thioesterase OTU1/2/3 like protein [Aduncisulcus paluster]
MYRFKLRFIDGKTVIISLPDEATYNQLCAEIASHCSILKDNLVIYYQSRAGRQQLELESHQLLSILDSLPKSCLLHIEQKEIPLSPTVEEIPSPPIEYPATQYTPIPTPSRYPIVDVTCPDDPIEKEELEVPIFDVESILRAAESIPSKSTTPPAISSITPDVISRLVEGSPSSNPSTGSGSSTGSSELPKIETHLPGERPLDSTSYETLLKPIATLSEMEILHHRCHIHSLLAFAHSLHSALDSSSLMALGFRPVLKHVSGDGGCLFHSLSFLSMLSMKQTRDIERKILSTIGIDFHFNPKWLRRCVCSVLNLFPNAFSGMLDEKIDIYATKMADESTWAGAVEIDILAAILDIEVHVLSVETMQTHRFGRGYLAERVRRVLEKSRFISEEQVSKRVIGPRLYLCYDGSHYNPLYFKDGSGQEIKCFIPSDEGIPELFKKEVVSVLHACKKYTKQSSMKIRCGNCGVILSGMKAAQKHAEYTGHQNFMEAGM